ncbi:MAG: helix-turn-helix domain-containing protein [Rhodobacteraceae bacterium]|nr:helix-turn-helix domain-containing protein [Paracoccaceae bacterium]
MSDDPNGWYGPNSATFGDRLAAARDAAGMTQEALAKRLGVKSGTLSNWEEDMSEPRANRLSMIAGLLNVSIMWLLNGEGEGLDDPDLGPDVAPDLTSLLIEIRDLRVGLRGTADRLAILEKRLKKALQESAQ